MQQSAAPFTPLNFSKIYFFNLNLRKYPSAHQQVHLHEDFLLDFGRKRVTGLSLKHDNVMDNPVISFKLLGFLIPNLLSVYIVRDTVVRQT